MNVFTRNPNLKFKKKFFGGMGGGGGGWGWVSGWGGGAGVSELFFLL